MSDLKSDFVIVIRLAANMSQIPVIGKQNQFIFDNNSIIFDIEIISYLIADAYIGDPEHTPNRINWFLPLCAPFIGKFFSIFDKIQG